VEFSGDSGRNDAPRRPQEMDAAAHLIREKGYPLEERLGFGPGASVQGYSPFGPEPGGLQGTIDSAEGLESAESAELFEPGIGRVYVGGCEPAAPAGMDQGGLPWHVEHLGTSGWSECGEPMVIADGMEPVARADYVGMVEAHGHARLAMEHALEGELHFAPAPTPEEELHVEAWHELEIAPEVEIQPMPALEPKPAAGDEFEPESEAAWKREPIAGLRPQDSAPIGTEEIQIARPKSTEKKKVTQAETPQVDRVIVWKDFPKPRR
jgi:hypothetical protein